MLRKLHKKIGMIRKLLAIGANPSSQINLVGQLLVLSIGRYVGFNKRPFSTCVRVGKNTSYMHFTGTMGELLTLVDIFADKSYEPDRTAEKALFPAGPKTILDLGANIGIASVWFLLTYPGCKLHAYEPNFDMFALLKDNLSQFPNAKVYEEAIAGTEGTVMFNKSAYSLESSIFDARESQSLSVHAITLDQAIERLGGSIDVLKIDIEGAEFDAFGSSRKLGFIKAIVGEAHTEQSGHLQEELSDLLSSFSVVKIYNPNNDTVFGLYAARVAI